MKLRSRFAASFLLVALLPLTLSMGISLWNSTQQTRELTLGLAHSQLDNMASELSAMFEQRRREIETYARMPALKSMDPAAFSTFLRDEIQHHYDRYEKFIIGLPSGHYYITTRDTPTRNRLASFDDGLPARLKSISRRDYWQHTISDQAASGLTAYVSNPMISYTTGVRQIVIASSILSDQGTTVGMLGGALPLENIMVQIDELKRHLVDDTQWSARFLLISPDGYYWYHWDPDKVVHFAEDEDGRVLLNEIGEKKTVRNRITDEPVAELAEAGRRMLAGKEGHLNFIDPQDHSHQTLLYTPVGDSGYAVAMVIPYAQLMLPVHELQNMLSAVSAATFIVILLFTYLLSRRIARPILELRDATQHMADGQWTTITPPAGNDEVTDLAHSFNTMSRTLRERDQQLRDSETRFNLAVRGSNDALWDWDLDRGKIWHSERLRELLGMDSGSFPDSPDSFGHYLHPDDLPRVTEAVRRHLEDDVPYDVEFRLQHHDGSYRWFRARGLALRDAQGRPFRMAGSNMDITDIKAAQDELVRAKEDAEEANKAKSQFLSSMSHELRTPLNAILGFAQLLELDESRNPRPDCPEYTREIIKAGYHLLELINEVLDLARIEAGRLTLEPVPVAISHIIQDCIGQIDTTLAKPRQINIINLTADSTVRVQADPLRLRQVLINLFTNAVKYNRDGGTVRIDIEELDNAQARLSIHDTGPGINPRDRHRLFDPFERLSFKNGPVEGSGIGLTVTRSLVEAMHGEIGVDSTPGDGSTFWFTLPLAQHENAQSPDNGQTMLDTQDLAQPKTRYRVLYIEDHPANVKLVAAALERTGGIDFFSAANAEHGLSLALETRPHLILMDINLPDMDGISALNLLRDVESTRHIPVVAISARALRQDIDAGREAGFATYLTKPIQITQLQHTVQDLLRNVDTRAARHKAST